MKYKIGFIGAGVMAGAILTRFLNSINLFDINSSDVGVYDLDTSKTDHFRRMGATVASSSNDILTNSEIVLLGVKPQFYADILNNAETVNAKTIISIMAGVKISTLRNYFSTSTGICRIMPNTPCVVGKGVMAVTFDGCNIETEAFITKILNTCGETLTITEDKFDTVTSISGSGPAYVYLFADSMVKAGIKGGLTEEESKKLALLTIEGSALYASQAEFDLPTLVERVCSKGGTTIEAINVFKNRNLPDIIAEGIAACKEKSEILSNKL